MNKLHNMDQLTGLITTLELQEKMKKDYVAPANSLSFVNGELVATFPDRQVSYEPTKIFHSQMAEKLNIPGGYYQRMLDRATTLLDANVNRWLSDESKNYLIRTFEDGAENYNTARALLSDSYSIIDNYQVLMEALQSIKESGVSVEVVAAELSDTKMYLKVVCPEVEISGKEMLRNYQVKPGVGDGVISGFTLSNSEIGKGAFNICPRALILTCGNGATLQTDALKNIHLGAKMDELGFNKNQDVMRANLKLIREQIKHAVKIFLSKEYLTKLVNVYSKLGEPKIEAPVQNIIQVVGKKFEISENRRDTILKYFIEGGDTRRMGLASAMTRECQEQADADVKHETELSAFDLLNNFQKIETEAMKIKSGSN